MQKIVTRNDRAGQMRPLADWGRIDHSHPGAQIGERLFVNHDTGVVGDATTITCIHPAIACNTGSVNHVDGSGRVEAQYKLAPEATLYATCSSGCKGPPPDYWQSGLRPYRIRAHLRR